jgi:hypothetical protein
MIDVLACGARVKKFGAALILPHTNLLVSFFSFTIFRLSFVQEALLPDLC